ncbi:hypothetical protein E1200_22505 [Actinomadura sp. GC306]|uniref:hypothetical protein n=1 Tax=Actinomadura sp. GC306 TaxID=2530367 RepID=UPI0010447F86|nr:hypothetical protein [Actinomadura sp. GC306]TDC63379.1 hypothetical protein E1200_22505 [Actinomadura sp. GC306]
MRGAAAARRAAVRAVPLVRPAGYVLIAVATVFLCTSLWSLFQAGRGADNEYAAARDELTRTAVQHITQLNSIDPKRVDLDLAHRLRVATGPFHDALEAEMPAARQKFAKQAAPSHGKITALAVTEFDDSAGKATVIASVRIFTDATGEDGRRTEQRKRYEVAMQRVGGAWKVSELNPLPPGGKPAEGSGS